MTINLYVTVPLFLVMPMHTALYKSSQLLLLLLLLLKMDVDDRVVAATSLLKFAHHSVDR